jgi:hypothetical protein
VRPETSPGATTVVVPEPVGKYSVKGAYVHKTLPACNFVLAKVNLKVKPERQYLNMEAQKNTLLGRNALEEAVDSWGAFKLPAGLEVGALNHMVLGETVAAYISLPNESTISKVVKQI